MFLKLNKSIPSVYYIFYQIRTVLWISNVIYRMEKPFYSSLKSVSNFVKCPFECSNSGKRLLGIMTAGFSWRAGFWIRWPHMERRMELLHHCSKLIIGLWLLKVLNENCTLVKHPGLFTRIKTGYGEQCSNRETSVQGDILECMRWRLDCVVGLSSEYYTSELFHFASLRIK